MLTHQRILKTFLNIKNRATKCLKITNWCLNDNVINVLLVAGVGFEPTTFRL